MNKRILLIVGSFLLIVILSLNSKSIVGSSPNTYFFNGDNTIHNIGYIQFRPSYNQNGLHASQGKLYFYEYDSKGNHLGTFVRNTEVGISQEDSKLYSLEYSHLPRDPFAQLSKGKGQFVWQKHSPVPYLY